MIDDRDNRGLIGQVARAGALVAAAFALAVVVSPLVFRVTQCVPVLQQFPFRRVFDRVVVVLIVVALLCGWRWLRIKFSFRQLLKRRNAVAWFCTWLVVGAVCIAILMLAQLHVHLRVVRQREVMSILQAIAVGFASAVAVGFIEECFFRGFFLHAVLQHTRRYTAIALVSLVFACVHLFTLDHFLKPIKHVQIDGTQWTAGFKLVSLFFVPLREPTVVLPGLIGLFLAGWLLAELAVRTRSLWPAIGLHAGWVWAIKALGHVLKYPDPPLADAGPTWFYGEKYAATGVLGWILVGIIILVANGLLLYALYRPVAALVPLLSHETIVRLGRAIGPIAFVLGRRQRRVALDNIRHAFPDMDHEGHVRIARESFDTLCMAMLEMLTLRSMFHQFHALVKVDRLDYPITAHAAGRPIVFFAGHLASWEVLALLCGVHHFPFTAVARPLSNEWIYGHIRQIRLGLGIALLDKKDIMRDILRALRAGNMVGFVGDQYAGSKGVFVNFFGRPASTIQAMALFARKTNAVISPAFDHLTPEGTHHVVFHPPFEVARTDNPEKDIFDATQRMMSLLEAEIRRTPGQYLWMHRKWRPRRAPAQGAA